MQLRLIWVVLFMAFSMSASRSLAQSGITQQNGRQVTCASDDGKRHLCRVDTSRGVQMTNQRSGSPCTQGQTWGYTRQGIWVDRGCRADFVLRGGGGPGSQPGPQPGGGGPGYGKVTVTCSSNNGQRNFCPANTSGGVQLATKRSGSPCVQGRTWGFNERSIWVDRGCRADFLVRR
jgi:Protein of unknown function (DUF3011)